MREASNIRNQVIELAGRPKLSFFELALAVKALHDENTSVMYGVRHQGGMSRRTAYYLLAVGKLIEARDLPKAVAEEIGWTKLQIVARHIDDSAEVSAEEFEEFLEIARVTKAGDLRKALNGHDVSVRTVAVFNLTKEDRSALDDVLVAFGAKKVPSGLADKEAALIQIIQVAAAAKSQSAG